MYRKLLPDTQYLNNNRPCLFVFFKVPLMTVFFIPFYLLIKLYCVFLLLYLISCLHCVSERTDILFELYVWHI